MAKFDTRSANEVLGKNLPSGGVVRLSLSDRKKLDKQKRYNIAQLKRFNRQGRSGETLVENQKRRSKAYGMQDTGESTREKYLKGQGQHALAAHEDQVSKGRPGLGKHDLRTAQAAAKHGTLTPQAAESKTAQGRASRSERRKKLMKAFR
jgi:hypothetical protein